MQNQDTSWLELNTYHPESAISFYNETLGWEFESTALPKGGQYWVARHNDKPVGGVFALDEADPSCIPAHWMTYMHVQDINQAQASARKAGGEVSRPALQLEGIGKLAVITDSTGALIGLIEPQKSKETKTPKSKS